MSVALATGCSTVDSLDQQPGELGGETGDVGDAGDEVGDEHGDEHGDEGRGDGDDDEELGDGDGDTAGNPYCDAVADWDSEWAAFGHEVMDRINQARMAGGKCGFLDLPPVPPLEWEPALACVARSHAGDMATHDFFNHSSSGGQDPTWRYEQSGFPGGSWAENLGAGYASPVEVVEGWFNSESQCANMRSDKFTWIGVGYAFSAESTYKSYWTLSLGAP